MMDRELVARKMVFIAEDLQPGRDLARLPLPAYLDAVRQFLDSAAG